MSRLAKSQNLPVSYTASDSSSGGGGDQPPRSTGAEPSESADPNGEDYSGGVVYNSLAGAQLSVAAPTGYQYSGLYLAPDIRPDKTNEFNHVSNYLDAINAKQNFITRTPWNCLTYSKFKHVLLNFSLELESRKLWDFVRGQIDAIGYDESAKRLASEYKPIELMLTQESLCNAMKLPPSVFNDAAEKYHIKVFDLKVQSTYNKFPIKFVANLVTDRVAAKGSNSNPIPVVWNNQMNASSNVGGDTSGYVIPESDSTVLVPRGEGLLHMADEYSRSALFSRWITANFNVLKRSFERVARTQYSGHTLYCVSLPAQTADMTKVNDLPVFFILNEFSKIVAKSEIFFFNNKLDPASINVPQQSTTNADELVMFVPKEVIDDILSVRASRFSRDKYLMNLNRVRLRLTPMQGLSGWHSLHELAKRYGNTPMQEPHNLARIDVQLRMSYHDFTPGLENHEQFN